MKINIIGLIVSIALGLIVGSIIIHHSQAYKIYQFEKDFADPIKPAHDIYTEGLKLASNADNPQDCLAATSAMWDLMIEEANKESDITHENIVEVANDKLQEVCK